MKENVIPRSHIVTRIKQLELEIKEINAPLHFIQHKSIYPVQQKININSYDILGYRYTFYFKLTNLKLLLLLQFATHETMHFSYFSLFLFLFIYFFHFSFSLNYLINSEKSPLTVTCLRKASHAKYLK